MPRSKKIRLARDTYMSTGYRGRGLVPLGRTFPAGTEALHSRLVLAGGEVVHTAKVRHDGLDYEAVKRVPGGDR